MRKRSLMLVGILLLLGLSSGCATKGGNTTSPNQYAITVEFASTAAHLTNTIEIATSPGFPFEVSVQDGVSNHYQVSGTLRKMSEHSFRLEQLRLESPLRSTRIGSLDLELGQMWKSRAIATIVQGWEGISITKK